MTLFGNLNIESSEVFLLAHERPDEFLKLIEVDNMITLCVAIENVYNTEMFLMGKTNTCYLSCPKEKKRELSMEVFLVNVGLKDEISLNTNLFKQAVETIKKIEDLMDTKKDGSQRLPNEVGVAWRLGACVSLNHVKDTRERFDITKMPERIHNSKKNRERKRRIRREGLTKETINRKNFKLTTTKSSYISTIPSFKIFFEGESERKGDCFTLKFNAFFSKMRPEMEKESNRVFPEGNGVFQRIRIESFCYEKNHSTEHILSLRFDGRRDVGPRGVLTRSINKDFENKCLYITDKEENEKNDLEALLKERSFALRECGVLEEGEDNPSPILFKEGRKLIKGPFTDLLTEVYRKIVSPHGVRDRFQAFLYPQTVVLSEVFISKRKKEEMRVEEVPQRMPAAIDAIPAEEAPQRMPAAIPAEEAEVQIGIQEEALFLIILAVQILNMFNINKQALG